MVLTAEQHRLVARVLAQKAEGAPDPIRQRLAQLARAHMGLAILPGTVASR